MVPQQLQRRILGAQFRLPQHGSSSVTTRAYLHDTRIPAGACWFPAAHDDHPALVNHLQQSVPATEPDGGCC